MITRVVSLALVLMSVVPAFAADVLFRGGRVFDGVRVLENTDVLVRDGKIVRVGKGIAAPEGAEVVDAAGKTLLPEIVRPRRVGRHGGDLRGRTGSRSVLLSGG